MFSTFTGVILFAGMVLLSLPQQSEGQENINNVTMVNGQQIIEIKAKGGYSPRTSLAQADVPNIIKVKTMGTFDCSSALTIPAIGYQKYLPASGETLIEIPPQKTGSTLQGLCAMGMYNFVINFR